MLAGVNIIPQVTNVSKFGKFHRTPIGNCISDGKGNGDFDVRPMEFLIGHITGGVHIKCGGRLIYPKEVTYIYHVNHKFRAYLSVSVRSVKVKA